MKWLDYPQGHKLVMNDSFVTNFRPAKEIVTDFIRLDTNGVLTAYKGYYWDGVSGPTFDTLNLRRASLVHDALYQLMRLKLLNHIDWRRADHMFKRYALADGVWRIRVFVLMLGLKIANGRHAHPRHRKIVQTFP